MKETRLIIKFFFLIVCSVSVCQAYAAVISEHVSDQPIVPVPQAVPIFVYSPVFMQRFKKNINHSIQHFSKQRKYVQVTTKEFFETAKKALSNLPAPYIGDCYRVKGQRGSSLRIAGTLDAHYARTLATLVRIFPNSDEWSFTLITPEGKIDYHFNRETTLQTAKAYLLSWSQRMQATDGLVPGVTPGLRECRGENRLGPKGMEVGILAYSFVSVYELLYPYLSTEDILSFNTWIATLKQEIIDGERYWIDEIAIHQPYNNHLSFHLLGLMSIAAANKDRKLFVEIIDGKQLGIVGSKNLKSMIEGAVYVENECSKSRYKTNPNCATFKRLNDSTRRKELKRYKITKMGCQKKHFFPKDYFPQTGEIWDRWRRVDKMKGSCAGKGMHYAMVHLKILTLLTLSAELNGFPLKHFVGKNGETLRSSYQFYARCLSKTDKNNYFVSEKIKSCKYYKGNGYPRHLIGTFHLASYLWPLNSLQAKQILNRNDQPLDLLNPLGHVQTMGLHEL